MKFFFISILLFVEIYGDINFDSVEAIHKKSKTKFIHHAQKINLDASKKMLKNTDKPTSVLETKINKFVNDMREEMRHSRSTTTSGSYCSADKECYRIISQSSDRIYIRCQSYNTSEQIVWIDRKSGEYVSSLTSPLAEHSHSFKKIANWQCGVY